MWTRRLIGEVRRHYSVPSTWKAVLIPGVPDRVQFQLREGGYWLIRNVSDWGQTSTGIVTWLDSAYRP